MKAGAQDAAVRVLLYSWPVASQAFALLSAAVRKVLKLPEGAAARGGSARPSLRSLR